jgi:hypothetical protein
MRLLSFLLIVAVVGVAGCSGSSRKPELTARERAALEAVHKELGQIGEDLERGVKDFGEKLARGQETGERALRYADVCRKKVAKLRENYRTLGQPEPPNLTRIEDSLNEQERLARLRLRTP